MHQDPRFCILSVFMGLILSLQSSLRSPYGEEDPACIRILTHLLLEKIATISQTIFSNAFSRMKGLVYWFESHWPLFLRVQLRISQHRFRKWLGAEQATSHYLNQCWPSSLSHICGARGRWGNPLCAEFIWGNTNVYLHSNTDFDIQCRLLRLTMQKLKKNLISCSQW